MAKVVLGSSEDSEGLSFEQSMERLEALVERLEAGHLSLEDTLHDYEQGMQLVESCRAELDRAEQRVRELRESAVATDMTPATED